MAEEPENLTLQLLREMRAEMEASREENKRLHAETRAELRGEIAKLDTRITLVLDAAVKTGEAVSAMAEVQEGHSATLSALLKHTGLVKT